jgi:hypothetical protein
MKNKEKIIIECLDEMYRASKPPITWNQIIEKYSDTGIPFYNLHKITEENYIRIKKKYKEKLGRGLHISLEMELLDYAPAFEIT